MITVLELTEEQRDECMPEIEDGELITIACRRRGENGGIEQCEPGEETPFKLCITATVKPH